MALSFTLLGSGSSGNATLVSDGDTHILVDVGLSGRETERRLAECGLTPRQITAIVVSHEHSDHCRGIAPFVKHLAVPVFITDGAYAASGMALPASKLERIESGRPFEIKGVMFTPFAVPHDAGDPIAFCIEKDGVRIAIVLDLGKITNLVAERLKGCDGIVLESNHDVRMLRVGPYPPALKARIKEDLGHLSNDQVSEYLAHRFDGRARHLILAHLSEKNNHPDIALISARQALEERSGLVSLQTRLDVARPDRVSARYRF